MTGPLDPDCAAVRVTLKTTARATGTQAARGRLIKRMFRVLEHQLKLLDEETDTVSNTEVTMLGNLVRSLDKLIELDNAEHKLKGVKRPSAEIDAIKQRLAERMAELERK